MLVSARKRSLVSAFTVLSIAAAAASGCVLQNKTRSNLNQTGDVLDSADIARIIAVPVEKPQQSGNRPQLDTNIFLAHQHTNDLRCYIAERKDGTRTLVSERVITVGQVLAAGGAGDAGLRYQKAVEAANMLYVAQLRTALAAALLSEKINLGDRNVLDVETIKAALGKIESAPEFLKILDEQTGDTSALRALFDLVADPELAERFVSGLRGTELGSAAEEQVRATASDLQSRAQARAEHDKAKREELAGKARAKFEEFGQVFAGRNPFTWGRKLDTFIKSEIDAAGQIFNGLGAESEVTGVSEEPLAQSASDAAEGTADAANGSTEHAAVQLYGQAERLVDAIIDGFSAQVLPRVEAAAANTQTERDQIAAGFGGIYGKLRAFGKTHESRVQRFLSRRAQEDKQKLAQNDWVVGKLAELDDLKANIDKRKSEAEEFLVQVHEKAVKDATVIAALLDMAADGIAAGSAAVDPLARMAAGDFKQTAAASLQAGRSARDLLARLVEEGPAAFDGINLGDELQKMSKGVAQVWESARVRGELIKNSVAALQVFVGNAEAAKGADHAHRLDLLLTMGSESFDSLTWPEDDLQAFVGMVGALPAAAGEGCRSIPAVSEMLQPVGPEAADAHPTQPNPAEEGGPESASDAIGVKED